MATSKILQFFETVVKPTFTFSSIANGAGRICSVIDNTTTRAYEADVYWQVKTGAAAPTASTPFKLYLIRRSNDGTNDIPDGETSAQTLGTADAAVSAEPTNAEVLGSIIVDAGTAKTWKKYLNAFGLSAKYGFVGWNAVGQTTDTTAGNHDLQVVPKNPESQ